MNFLKYLFMSFFLLVSLNAQGFNSEEIFDFKNKKDFILKGGYLELDPLGGFADGKYRLQEYEIVKKQNYLYDIKMRFVLKKKKYLRYTQSLQLPLLYDGKRVWIKYKGEVFKYSVPKSMLVRYEKREREFIKRVQNPLEVKMKNLVLKFEF